MTVDPCVPLAERVALVTGGGNGIGERSAMTLAARGAEVVIVDLDRANGQRVVDAIIAGGGRASLIVEDCTRPDAVDRIYDRIARDFGRLDVLDNNAAALQLTADDRTVLDTEPELFADTMRANVVGTFLMCRPAIRMMRGAGGGSIVNIASVSGLRGEPALTAYGVSKAAVIQLTRIVATQYGPDGIRCNAVAPSYVTTPNNARFAPAELSDAYQRHTPSGRLDSPQDVAELVAFLASDSAAQINGQVIAVDGGFAAASPIVADVAALAHEQVSAS